MAGFSHDLQEGLEGRYRVSMAWRHETVEFLGLPYLKEERPLTLPEIYVPLSLTRSHGDKERLYVPEALEQHRHLVVLGDPGSGKSTLVKLLAYSFGRIEPTPLARRLGAYLPIPIILRDYNVRRWQSPEDMLGDFVAQLDEDIRSAVTVPWLLDALVEGRGMLLLDGLDEVGSRQERAHVRDQVIWPLLSRMPESLAVLTSRSVGYEEVPFDTNVLGMGRLGDFTLTTFQRCYVAPFNDEEIDQFISKWYTARERDERERQRRLVSLREALQRSDRIRRLASNPSLLTLMALIHRVTAELPSGRVKLYDKIVEAYLETIQRYRGLTTFEASLEQMKRWLATVGWEMQSRRSREQDGDLLATREEVLGWLTQAIAVDESNARAEAEQCLEYIARRSGLLVPRGPEHFAFVHLTFQEYFAAWHMRGLLRRFESLVQTCAERVTSQRWHETLVLLFELLAEFSGAGDDLLDELQQRAQDRETRRGVATLGAELLLDEHSGLSLSHQKKAAHFALQETCADYNEAVSTRLQNLPAAKFEMLVRPWLEEQLHSAGPEAMGQDFFLAARAFEVYETDWPETVSQWVRQHGHLSWGERYIVNALVVGEGHPEVCAWVGGSLPLAWWLDSTRSFVSLGDQYMPSLLMVQNQSPRHRLLAQCSAAFAVSRTHSLPFFSLLMTLGGNIHATDFIQTLTQNLDLNLAQIRVPVRTLMQAQAQTRFLAQARSRFLFLAREPLRNLSRTQRRAVARAMAAEVAWALTQGATQSITPDWLLQTTELATEIAWAEWLFSAPEASSDLMQTHLATFRYLATAPDDWTRLSGLTSLMLLGEGTPQRCAERNALLDRGMQHPAAFTFPPEVREVTDTDAFHQEFPALLQLAFLHQPGKPWLQPEWFDPAHPAARFFRATPREFFAQAAEVLDPEGKTELARWRQQKAP